MDLCRRPVLRSLSQIRDLSVTNQIAPFVTSIIPSAYNYGPIMYQERNQDFMKKGAKLISRAAPIF